MQPLDSFQLAKILTDIPQTARIFKKVLARGSLPILAPPDIPAAYVINTAFYWERPGEHWVLIVYLKDFNIFCCSYGLPASVYNFVFLTERGGLPLLQNTRGLQSQNSSVCGHYCIYILYFLSIGRSLTSILQDFSPENTDYNDLKVFKFVSNLAWRHSQITLT